MANSKIPVAIVMLFVLFLFNACTDSDSNQQKTVFKQVPEIAEIKPQTPVKIKLKRNASGNYSWDLSGSDAKKVLETDRILKESLDLKDE